MQDKIRTARIKETRGSVLMALNRNLSAPITVKTLETALYERNPYIRGDLQDVLYYLEDKEYVELVRMDNPQLVPMHDSMVRICAKGMDLIEETIEDPGVIFGDASRA